MGHIRCLEKALSWLNLGAGFAGLRRAEGHIRSGDYRDGVVGRERQGAVPRS